MSDDKPQPLASMIAVGSGVPWKRTLQDITNLLEVTETDFLGFTVLIEASALVFYSGAGPGKKEFLESAEIAWDTLQKEMEGK